MIFLANNRISLTSVVKSAQWKKGHTLICPICGKTFIDYGVNPYPIMGDGRCCDDCRPMAIIMDHWLDRNRDELKGLVDKLSNDHPTALCDCYHINGESVAFTFYKDVLTNKLEVVAVCDDERREKVVVGALQYWIAQHYSDKDLNGVPTFSKGQIRHQINQVKTEFKEKIANLALKHKKLENPYLIFDSDHLNIDDKDVAHFGFFIWSKNDGVLTAEPFFLGINEHSEFAKWWDKFVKEQFIEMINNYKGRIPYFLANSKEEAMYEMYISIFNKEA